MGNWNIPKQITVTVKSRTGQPFSKYLHNQYTHLNVNVMFMCAATMKTYKPSFIAATGKSKV